MRDSSIRSKLKKLKVYRQLINYGILEDISEPKEAAHLDYKYLKTFEGPLTQQLCGSMIKENEAESEKLLSTKKKGKKPVFSFERKKFGGLRMC